MKTLYVFLGSIALLILVIGCDTDKYSPTQSEEIPFSVQARALPAQVYVGQTAVLEGKLNGGVHPFGEWLDSTGSLYEAVTESEFTPHTVGTFTFTFWGYSADGKADSASVRLKAIPPDTTIQIDSIPFPVVDTLIDSIPYFVYDSTTIIDSIPYPVIDSIPYPVFDTVEVIITDTDTLYIVDTLIQYEYITEYIYEYIYVTDTLWQTDTLIQIITVTDTVTVPNVVYLEEQYWRLEWTKRADTVQLSNPGGRFIVGFDRRTLGTKPDDKEFAIQIAGEEHFFSAYGDNVDVIWFGPMDVPACAEVIIHLTDPYYGSGKVDGANLALCHDFMDGLHWLFVDADSVQIGDL